MKNRKKQYLLFDSFIQNDSANAGSFVRNCVQCSYEFGLKSSISTQQNHLQRYGLLIEHNKDDEKRLGVERTVGSEAPIRF